MIRIVIIAAAAACLQLTAGECMPVNGDHILGRDLKAASPGFESVRDDAVIALAPAPGIERALSPQEKARLGDRSAHACFVRLTHAVSVEAIEAAMRAALAGRDIEIQIIDYSRAGIPEGALEFPLSALTQPPASKLDAPVLWRGRIRYDGTKTLPVWASVRLTEARQWIEAAAVLAPGKIVETSQLIQRSGRLFPLLEVSTVDIGRIAGRTPRRLIAAGQIVSAAMFVEPPAVVKGDAVSVAVVSGAVELRFDGRAETSGRVNDRILVFDPAQGRRMKGKVIEKGKVVIDAKEQVARAVPERGVRADAGGGRVAQENGVEDAGAVGARQVSQ